MCLKCYNKFTSATFDQIGVDQRAMPKESKTEWIIVGVVIAILVIIFVIMACYWVKHHEKKTENWRADFVNKHE